MNDVAVALNSMLHSSLGVGTPCATACTHEVVGSWTALGVANVIGRAHDRDMASMAGPLDWVEVFRKALMRGHSADWDMDTVAEAAHICAQAVEIASPLPPGAT